MFKVGDKVVCVDAEGWNNSLTRGKAYTVQGTCGKQIRIITDKREDGFFNEHRFVKVEEKEMQKNFTKADLKTGMRVVHANGETYIVIREEGGDGVFVSRSGFNPLSLFKDNLEADSISSDWDVVEVYARPEYYFNFLYPEGKGILLWKRETTSPVQKELDVLKQKSKELQEQIATLEATMNTTKGE